MSYDDWLKLYDPILSERFLNCLLIKDYFEAAGGTNVLRIDLIVSNLSTDGDAPCSDASSSRSPPSLADIFAEVGVTRSDIDNLVGSEDISTDSIDIVYEGHLVQHHVCSYSSEYGPVGADGYSSEYGPVGADEFSMSSILGQYPSVDGSCEYGPAGAAKSTISPCRGGHLEQYSLVDSLDYGPVGAAEAGGYWRGQDEQGMHYFKDCFDSSDLCARVAKADASAWVTLAGGWMKPFNGMILADSI